MEASLFFEFGHIVAQGDSYNLIESLIDILTRAPLNPLLGNLSVTSVHVTVLKRGCIRRRIRTCHLMKLWCPALLVYTTRKPLLLQRTTMRRGFQAIQTGKVFALYIPCLTLSLRLDPRMVVLMYDIGRNPRATSWLLNGLPIEAVLLLLKHHTVIRNTPWREIVHGCILNHLRNQWNFSPTRPLIIKTPPTSTPDTLRALRALVSRIFQEMQVQPASLNSLMVKRLKIMPSKAKSISDKVSNVIHTAKTLKWKQEPPCSCAEISNYFPPTTGNHYCARARTAIHPWLRHALATNASTTIFEEDDHNELILQTVCGIFTETKSWLGRTAQETTTSMHRIAKTRAEGHVALPHWSEEEIDEVVATAAILNVIPTTAIWACIAVACSKLKDQTSNPDGITSRQVNEARKCLSNSICSPLDKNAGQLVIMCPLRYHQAFLQMFNPQRTRKTVSFSDLRGSVTQAVTPPGRPAEHPPEGPADAKILRGQARGQAWSLRGQA